MKIFNKNLAKTLNITKFYLIFIVLFGSFFTSFAQNNDFNLKNLKQVDLILTSDIRIDQDFTQKLEVNIKLKLQSAGIIAVSGSVTLLKISVDRINDKNIFLVSLRLIDSVSVRGISTIAYTYQDTQLFNSIFNFNGTLEKAVMDKLLIRFLDKYLKDNF